MDQATARSGATKPWPSSWPRLTAREQRDAASCSGVEEHRTGGRSGRRRSERSMVERHQDAISSRGRRPRGGGRSPSFKRQSKKPRRGSFHKKNKKVKQNTG
ncbi:MAG: hypothetical protein WC502_10330 [Methanolinea sp.]